MVRREGAQFEFGAGGGGFKGFHWHLPGSIGWMGALLALRIQRLAGGQVEFLPDAGVGGVGPGIFAVGGVLELAAAHGQAVHHGRQFHAQRGRVAFSADLIGLGLLVGVERGLEVGAVLGGDRGQGVGLELVDDVGGGGFQRGAVEVQVGADGVFGQDVAVAAGVFETGLALDVMDFAQQRGLGGVFGGGLELAFHAGLGGVAGVLAGGFQVGAQRGQKGGGDDLFILDLRKNRRVAVDDAVDDVGFADFGELMLVEQAVMFRGFAAGWAGAGAGGVVSLIKSGPIRD